MQPDEDIPTELQGNQVFIGVKAPGFHQSLSISLDSPFLEASLKGEIPGAEPGSEITVVIKGVSNDASSKIFEMFHWHTPPIITRGELLRALQKENQ